MLDKKKLLLILNTFVLLILMSKPALANAGSPIMWLGLLHLCLGNTLIGAFEACLVAKLQNLHLNVWKIILGNYISMFFGFFFIAPFFSSIAGNRDFWGNVTNFGDYQLKGFILGMNVAYFSTLLIEYPFFHWAIAELAKKSKAFKATVFSNSISYVVMIGIYLWLILPGSKW